MSNAAPIIGVVVGGAGFWLALSGDLRAPNLAAAAGAGALAAIVAWRARRELPAMRARPAWLRFAPDVVLSALRDSARVLFSAVRPGPFRRGAWIEIPIEEGVSAEHVGRSALLELGLSFGPGSAVAEATAGRVVVHVIHSARDAGRVEELL